jgi:hypothetical protein
VARRYASAAERRDRIGGNWCTLPDNWKRTVGRDQSFIVDGAVTVPSAASRAATV